MNQDGFYGLAETLFSGLARDETLLCRLDAEDSDFIRLNEARIRQAGSVRRGRLDLTLIEGRKQVDGDVALAFEPAEDARRGTWLLEQLRERIAHVPEDPYLAYSHEPSEGSRHVGGPLPGARDAVEEVLADAEDLDLVGIWASGTLVSALATSLGHRQWHASESYNLDFSCYARRDKAVKAELGGLEWRPELVGERLAEVRRDLEIIARPAYGVVPGRYRAYLAPAAICDILELLSDGFDLKSHRTRQTPLRKLAEGTERLHSDIGLSEAHDRGLVPRFTPEGFPLPDAVALIEGGEYRDCLTDARDGQEYGVAVNASSSWPVSLALGGGDLPAEEVLDALDTGLYIGNLWYCNYVDRNDCRLTGMTRFGTFWVQDGELVAPIDSMRFDDSLFSLFGSALERLTRERRLILSAETYGGRCTSSYLLPGALVEQIALTL